MAQYAADHGTERRRRYSVDPDSDRERIQPDNSKRRSRRATESGAEGLSRNKDRSSRSYDYSTESSPSKQRSSRQSRSTSSKPLSLDTLASLDAQNAKRGWKGYDEAYLKEVRQKESRMEKERRREQRDSQQGPRQSSKPASQERSRRLSDARAARDIDADRQTAKDEERERRREVKREAKREEKRRLKRAEKQRLRELDREEEVAVKREDDRQRQPEKNIYMTRIVTERDVREHSRRDSAADRKRSNKRQSRAYDSDARPEEEEEEEEEEESRSREETELEETPKREKVVSTKTRVISGPLLERGVGDAHREKKNRGGGDADASDFTTDSEWKKKRNKRLC